MISSLLFIIYSHNFPWYVARAAGISAYLLLFLVVTIGTGLTTNYTYRFINPIKAWIIHKYLSIALGITLLTHVISLLFDSYINLKLLDLLIPFYSRYNSNYIGLGIFSFYLLLIIVFSSLFFRLKNPRIWRIIHYFTYPIFILSCLHGILIGSDTKTITMKLVYWFTGSIFLILMVYRLNLRKRNIEPN